MHYQRELGSRLRSLAGHFPVVLLTGARQTGKTTLLRETFPDHHYLSLDLPSDAATAESSPDTFFGHGIVAHVSLAHPVSAALADVLYAAAKAENATVHKGGCYLNMEGPQFSTRAESHLHRSWGAQVVGMTNVTEARLCREAGICYCAVAMVTDYDCWKEDEEGVSVDALLAILHDNAKTATDTVGQLIGLLPERRSCACGKALDAALITDPKVVPPATREQLRLILGDRLRES